MPALLDPAPGDRSGGPGTARWCPVCRSITVQPDQHQCPKESR